jgi:phosphatidylserine/phosphatidylglycerophosphate/cardiolipin synthase-like enzyme
MASEPLSPGILQNPPSLLVNRTARVATGATNTIRIPHDKFFDRQGELYSTSNMPPVIAGNQVKFFIDGNEAFQEMAAAIRTANAQGHFIYMVNWFCDVDFHLLGASEPENAQTNLRGLLTDASSKDVMIRAMFWKMPAGLSQNRDAVLFLNSVKLAVSAGGPILVPCDAPHPLPVTPRLKNAAAIFDQRGDQNLPIPILSILPRAFGSQHQKFLCVSGDQGLVCFCGGIDFNPDRISGLDSQVEIGPASGDLVRTFIGKIKRKHHKLILDDTSANKDFDIDDQDAAAQFEGKEVTLRGVLDPITNAIRIDQLQGGQTEHGAPLHDVHCRIIGPAASELVKLFTQKWTDHRQSSPIDSKKGPLLPAPATPNSGEHFVQIGRTFGNTGYTTIKPEQTAASMIAHAIRNAKRFIYTECQYFTGSPDLEAALKAALPNIQHLTVVITHWEVSDLPTVNAHRRDFLQSLKAAGGDKVRIFTLQPDGNTEEFQDGKVPHTYVHSKIWIIDDEFAVIGTVNSNRRSWSHDAEVAAGIYEPSTDLVLHYRFAHLMRIEIWKEHLNMQSSEGSAELADGVASAVHWVDLSPRARVRRYNVNERNRSNQNDQHIPVPILWPLLEALTWDGVFDPS